MNAWAQLIESHGGRPFVDDDEGRSFSYADALSYGRALLAPVGDQRAFVVLLCSNAAPSIAAYLALLASDHAVLLVERDLAAERLTALLGLYSPDAVVDPLDETPVRRLRGGTELHPDLALLLSTSGSTGSPKLARFTSSAIRANAASIAEYLNLTPDERPLLHLPTSYSYGMSVINSHLLVGAPLSVTACSPMQPGFWDRLSAVEATSIAGVPFHYDMLRRFGTAKLELPHLRTLTQAGGKLAPSLVKLFGGWAQQTGRRFFVMYGQTEAGPRISYLPPERAAEAPESVGIAIPGVELSLLDDAGQPIEEAGVAGELVCRSPAIMMGYALSASDLSRGDEQCGLLRTGDVAQRSEDGLITIVGRSARMVKLYGVRVNLDDVDALLLSRGYRAAAFGGDDQLKIAVEGADPKVVRALIIESFSFPPRGFDVRSLPAIPRAASGKVLYADIARHWDDGLAA
ncbi:AMP-binding protein [Sphingomonas sp.]|jgi:acyl-coenzyme A synthetase/AMP-(fatty) acid ligase|uniref:AMP-binding protein n=1 Tax=Sphingomonas sp. TaxID=28214 RepID=UPI002DE6A02D|nr:AMP-binding protein [Sphingomonas sp.]